MIIPIDHKALAVSRLAVQFRESPNLIGFIQAIIQEGEDLEVVFQQILNERSISNAVGVQLDILGELVGQSRYIENGFFAKFFGFNGQPNGTGFNQNTFWNGIQGLITDGNLDDDTYRLYIRAKAFTNLAKGKTEDFIAVFKILFGEDTKTITFNPGNAHCHIAIAHEFTPEEEQLIVNSKQSKVLPLAAGIKYTFFKTSGNGSFGFNGNPFATGFNNGGFLSEIGATL